MFGGSIFLGKKNNTPPRLFGSLFCPFLGGKIRVDLHPIRFKRQVYSIQSFGNHLQRNKWKNAHFFYTQPHFPGYLRTRHIQVG